MAATTRCGAGSLLSRRSMQQLLCRCLCAPRDASCGRSWRCLAAAAAAGAEGTQQLVPPPPPPPPQQQQQQPQLSEVLKQLEADMGQLSHQPMVPPPQPRVVVISGPSGVGKDAVIKRLQQLRPDLYFVVTATSRQMRPGEVEGVDYFFVSRGTFESWIASGQLLEHALVYGEYKGIPRAQVDAALAAGSDVVLRLDVQGAATLRALMPEAISVFIVAESEAQLVGRLVARKTEPLDKMVTRVKTARQETRQMADFDYVVVNREGRLDECVAQLGAIIDAEKLRSQPRR